MSLYENWFASDDNQFVGGDNWFVEDENRFGRTSELQGYALLSDLFEDTSLTEARTCLSGAIIV